MRKQNRPAVRRALTGEVVRVLDDSRVVIDKGSIHGVNMDDRFLLYKEGEEIFDPESNETLGHLELVGGEGKPEEIQEEETILTSSRVRIQKPGLYRAANHRKLPVNDNAAPEKKVPVPFKEVEKGYLFKQVR